MFGDDIASFADAWVDEHRRPPNQLKLALLRFASYGVGWLAIQAVQRLIDVWRNNATDEIWSTHLVVALALGATAAAGHLVGRVFDRSTRPIWQTLPLGIGAVAAILFGAFFGLTRAAEFFLSVDFDRAEERIPSFGTAVLAATVCIPLFFWAISARIRENDKRIIGLFGDDDRS